MKKIILCLFCIIGMQAMAQDKMRITLIDGTPIELSTNNVKEMTFYTPEVLNITGEWLQYVDQLGGVMESYDFKENGILYYKVFYYAYPILNDEAYYTYTFVDNVVTILNNGSPATAFTIDSFDGFHFSTTANTTFYKVQRVYEMKTTDEPLSIGNDGDIIKYVDKSYVEIENNKIKPLKPGSGYAIVEDKESMALKAYRIDIQGNPEVVNFLLYFKKSRSDIESEFGSPDQINTEKHTISYTNRMPMLIFAFNANFSEVESVHALFNNESELQPYCDAIAAKYILDSETENSKTYYDTEDKNIATIRIRISIGEDYCSIVYTDLKTTSVPVTDWTTFFKKSGNQIKAEFGSSPDITDDDEDEDYSMVYYNINDYKYISFSFNKGFEKVTGIRVSFKDASSMQSYCDAIASKYIMYSDTGTRKTYYDTDKASTASVRVVIQSSGSNNYITYTDMSE